MSDPATDGPRRAARPGAGQHVPLSPGTPGAAGGPVPVRAAPVRRVVARSRGSIAPRGGRGPGPGQGGQHRRRRAGSHDHRLRPARRPRRADLRQARNGRPRDRAARRDVGTDSRADHRGGGAPGRTSPCTHRRHGPEDAAAGAGRDRPLRGPGSARRLRGQLQGRRSGDHPLRDDRDRGPHRDHRAAPDSPDDHPSLARVCRSHDTGNAWSAAQARTGRIRRRRRARSPGASGRGRGRWRGRASPWRTACGYSRGRRASRHRRGGGCPRCR